MESLKSLIPRRRDEIDGCDWLTTDASISRMGLLLLSMLNHDRALDDIKL